MRRFAILTLLCLFWIASAAQAAETKKIAPVRPVATTPPYWFHYPQFTDAEVRLVVNWFQDAREAKRLRIAPLPAVVAHEIHITGRLTASMVKSMAAPPAELDVKLLPLPEGYQRLLAGSVLLILKTDEQLVVDTLPVGGK